MLVETPRFFKLIIRIMQITTLNRLVDSLLIYMIGAILLIGLSGNDIVTDMANFLLIYGIPLSVVIIIYLTTTGMQARLYLQGKPIEIYHLLIISAKLLIAMVPMFFLDDTGAYVLSTLRD